MTRLRPTRTSLAILAMAVVFGLLASLLPDNPYQRWQLLDGTIHARARWIYERIHYDPTPIDVAFLGPSRLAAGVDAPRLAATLKARGLPNNVVNFSLVDGGRNINYAVVEEMLATKKPKLLVIGVIELPSRHGHPAFKYVGRPGLIADPEYFPRFQYFPDLAYLPFRQMRLFAATIAPRTMGLEKAFDPTVYAGSSIDTTGRMRLPDGRLVADGPASPEVLAKGVYSIRHGAHWPVMPGRLTALEFGDEWHYVRRIVALAEARGVQVAFLNIPYYTGPAAIHREAFYRQSGPIWNPAFLSSHAEWYRDYAHLDGQGADVLTDWLVEPVSAVLTSAR